MQLWTGRDGKELSFPHAFAFTPLRCHIPSPHPTQHQFPLLSTPTALSLYPLPSPHPQPGIEDRVFSAIHAALMHPLLPGTAWALFAAGTIGEGCIQTERDTRSGGLWVMGVAVCVAVWRTCWPCRLYCMSHLRAHAYHDGLGCCDLWQACLWCRMTRLVVVCLATSVLSTMRSYVILVSLCVS